MAEMTGPVFRSDREHAVWLFRKEGSPRGESGMAVDVKLVRLMETYGLRVHDLVDCILDRTIAKPSSEVKNFLRAYQS